MMMVLALRVGVATIGNTIAEEKVKAEASHQARRKARHHSRPRFAPSS